MKVNPIDNIIKLYNTIVKDIGNSKWYNSKCYYSEESTLESYKVEQEANDTLLNIQVKGYNNKNISELISNLPIIMKELKRLKVIEKKYNKLLMNTKYRNCSKCTDIICQ